MGLIFWPTLDTQNVLNGVQSVINMSQTSLSSAVSKHLSTIHNHERALY